MTRKKKQPDPDVIRFRNCVAPVVPGFTIVDLSEADIRLMASGKVPAWLLPTLEWWLRENPKPSDVPPIEEPEAVDAVARAVAS